MIKRTPNIPANETSYKIQVNTVSSHIIIIMKICKVPTQQLKVLNKHITHIMYIKMENFISNLTKTNT